MSVVSSFFMEHSVHCHPVHFSSHVVYVEPHLTCSNCVLIDKVKGST